MTEPSNNTKVPKATIITIILALVGIILLFFLWVLYGLPYYEDYTNHLANIMEPKQNLQAIYTAYQSYHSQYGTYPTSPSILVGGKTWNCLNITDWEPKGELRYTYECEGSQAYWPGWNWVRSMGASPCSPAIKTHATKDSFTIGACGNIDADATLDEWTIDDSKHLRNILDDLKN